MVQMCGRFRSTCFLSLTRAAGQNSGSRWLIERGGGVMKKGISNVFLFAYKNAQSPCFLNTEEITQLRASFLAYSSRPAPGSNVTPNPSVSCIQSRFYINDCSGSLKFPFPACFNMLSFCLLLHLNCIVHPHVTFFPFNIVPKTVLPEPSGTWAILHCGWKQA